MVFRGGLAPVLDVTADARWGRTEETISEDPYLLAVLGSAYAAGLQSAGVVATLKQFAGLAGSGGARQPRAGVDRAARVADVVLPPFEVALLEGGARSVMHSYTAVDGVPPAADPALLTDLLRRLGCAASVVAAYFGVGFPADDAGRRGVAG